MVLPMIPKPSTWPCRMVAAAETDVVPAPFIQQQSTFRVASIWYQAPSFSTTIQRCLAMYVSLTIARNPQPRKVTQSLKSDHQPIKTWQPLDRPIILASSSFVGLGVVTSDVYVSDNVGWYLNTNNFLRSVRNFIIDIRNTDQSAYVCAIHWQVAQATSLENIDFYMTDPADNPDTTQQGRLPLSSILNISFPALIRIKQVSIWKMAQAVSWEIWSS